METFILIWGICGLISLIQLALIPLLVINDINKEHEENHVKAEEFYKDLIKNTDYESAFIIIVITLAFGAITLFVYSSCIAAELFYYKTKPKK